MNLLMVNDAVLELRTMAGEIPWKTYGIDEVYTAESAAQARKILQSHRVEILLCDIEMPGEDGISLIRWIREKAYDIECILLTCHSDFVYAKEAISLGCREYIVLPAPYEEIGRNVQKVVLQRQDMLREKELTEYGRNWIEQQRRDLENQKPQEPSTKETVEKCAAYIQSHLNDEDLNVNSIGEHFFLNPIYLSRIFKKEKGVAINQWITRQRMGLAARLLKESDMTATAVAEHCGYANYPYFSTVFKSHFGCTPSQYIHREEG